MSEEENEEPKSFYDKIREQVKTQDEETRRINEEVEKRFTDEVDRRFPAEK